MDNPPIPPPRHRLLLLAIATTLIAIVSVVLVARQSSKNSGNPSFLYSLGSRIEKPSVFLMSAGGASDWVYFEGLHFRQSPTEVLSQLRKKLAVELGWAETVDGSGVKFENPQNSEEWYLFDNGVPDPTYPYPKGYSSYLSYFRNSSFLESLRYNTSLNLHSGSGASSGSGSGP